MQSGDYDISNVKVSHLFLFSFKLANQIGTYVSSSFFTASCNVFSCYVQNRVL